MLTAILRDRAAADDVAQDVFVLALRRGLSPGPGAGVWLRRVARYLALNERRRRRPLPVDPQTLAELADMAPRTGVADGDEPPFERQLAVLRSCLAELATDDRELLEGRYARLAPLATLAQCCDQSPGYVKQRLFRLRRRLGACVRRRLALGEVTGEA